jgi:hypothetical protein
LNLKGKAAMMDSSEFVALLAKYRMTFYWGAINKNWWIIGPVENGCNQDTSPEPAENFDAAQIAALKYIHEKYNLIPLTVLT